MIDVIDGKSEKSWSGAVPSPHCHNLTTGVNSSKCPICSSLATTSEHRLDLFHDLLSNFPVWVFHRLLQLVLEALRQELFSEFCKIALILGLGVHALYRTVPLHLIKE